MKWRPSSLAMLIHSPSHSRYADSAPGTVCAAVNLLGQIKANSASEAALEPIAADVVKDLEHLHL
jgi:hypothetical protein